MLNLAKERPLVGGGFELAKEEVYQKYAPDPSFTPQVAHSIYFQAMGEHGFVGLGLYLLLLFAFWRQCSALVRMARGQPHLQWVEEFGPLMQVSIIGFAVGGVFLSLINYDVPYYLVAATVATRALVYKELQRDVTSAPGLADQSESLAGSRANRPTTTHGA